MKFGDFKKKVMENDDNLALEPLRNLFMFMDILNEDYKKEFGEDSPYIIKDNEEV